MKNINNIKIWTFKIIGTQYFEYEAFLVKTIQIKILCFNYFYIYKIKLNSIKNKFLFN